MILKNTISLINWPIQPSLGIGILSPLSIGTRPDFSWDFDSFSILSRFFSRIGWYISNLVESEWWDILSSISVSVSIWAFLLNVSSKCNCFNPDLKLNRCLVWHLMKFILTREIQDKTCQKEEVLQQENTNRLWSLAILVTEDLKGRHLCST